MIEAIRHGLTGVAQYGGRDGRQAFWYFVLFVFIVGFIVSTAFSLATIGPMLASAISAGTDRQPPADATTLFDGRGAGMVRTMFTLGLSLGVAKLALLSPALARRAHDSGLSTALALIAPALYTLGLVVLAANWQLLVDRQIAAVGHPDIALANLRSYPQVAVTLLEWSAAVVAVIIGVRKSTPGPNPYGRASFNV
ncbi:MAG: DUF805 domain-containing protein [Novosphingobium sp.]|nr:DUF805 domain-containing protein [Novosphingobium sp.]